MQGRTYSSPAFSRPLSILVRALVLLLVSLAFFCGGALATPPSNVVVTYDQNTGDLLVAITHPVEYPTTHYIKQVTVTQGDIVLVDKSYTSQPDRSSFTYRYNLPQLKGSSGAIRADAQCNLAGSRSGTLTLSAIPASGTSASASSSSSAAPTPAKSPSGVFVAVVAVGFIARYFLG